MSGWVTSVDEMEKREEDQLLICLKLSHGNEISLRPSCGLSGPMYVAGRQNRPQVALGMYALESTYTNQCDIFHDSTVH